MEKTDNYLIVGLGNPGVKYENTLHNIGRIVVREFGKDINEFKESKKFFSLLSRNIYENKKINLLLPQTYMNNSGKAVLSFMSFYNIDIENILIIADDVYIPFGELRFRTKGSSGGHNGLKDIGNKLNTVEYSRLKIGVGLDERMQLDDYVISKFTKEKKDKLPYVINEAINVIKLWIREGSDKALDYISLKNKGI